MDQYNTKQAVLDESGGWKLRILRWPYEETSFCIADGSSDSVFIITVENATCWIHNVSASLLEWRAVLFPLLGLDEPSVALPKTLAIEHRERIDAMSSPSLVVSNPGYPNRVTIYYSSTGLEINGVHASMAEWRRVLPSILSEGR